MDHWLILIDALFVLFTERRQRAFELLTKTRAVAMVLCFVALAPEVARRL
jgi:hypothetical protein